MNVTEVTIDFIKPQDGLIAFASVVLDDALYLSSIGVHRKLDGSGYRLTYPNRKVGERKIDMFHPIRHGIGRAIEVAIVEKLKEVMRNVNAGHNDIGFARTRL